MSTPVGRAAAHPGDRPRHDDRVEHPVEGAGLHRGRGRRRPRPRAVGASEEVTRPILSRAAAFPSRRGCTVRPRQRQRAPPAAEQRARHEHVEQQRRHRVGQRVGPRATAGARGDDRPAGHPGGVAEQPGPRAAQRRERRDDAHRGQRGGRGRTGRRGAAHRGPQRLRVARRAAPASRRTSGRPPGRDPSTGTPRPPDRLTARSRAMSSRPRRATAACPPARSYAARVSTRNCPLAAASDGRGDRSASRSGSVVAQSQGASGCTSRSASPAGQRARPRARRGRARARRARATRRGEGVGEAAARRRRRTPARSSGAAVGRRGPDRAGVRLAQPAGRQRAGGHQPHPRVGRRRARRRRVPSVEPSSTTTTRRSVDAALVEQPRPGSRRRAPPRRAPAGRR